MISAVLEIVSYLISRRSSLEVSDCEDIRIIRPGKMLMVMMIVNEIVIDLRKLAKEVVDLDC